VDTPPSLKGGSVNLEVATPLGSVKNGFANSRVATPLGSVTNDLLLYKIK
jgi:hypothetical protein